MVTPEALEEYEEYIEKQSTNWIYPHGLIESYCKKHPKHTEDDVIVAKIWMIGRGFSAAIERTPGGLNYYEDVVPIMKEVGSELDKRIAALKKSKRSMCEDVVEILSLHKRLTDIFKNISGRNNRSLASKYLYFHCPDKFFLYDSRAKEKVKEYVELPRRTSLASIKDCDYDYKLFVARMLELQEEIFKQTGKYEKPKELDRFLLEM